MMKDEGGAHAAFRKARLEQEKIVQVQPDYGPARCVLGLIDASLGRKEEALGEGRRAIELLPVEKDSLNGSQMLIYFAIIAAWADEKDTALQYLAANGQSQGGYIVATYGANRRLARAEKAEQVNAVTESEKILRRAEAGQHLHHDRA